MSSKSNRLTALEALELILDHDSEIEEEVSEDEDHLKWTDIRPRAKMANEKGKKRKRAELVDEVLKEEKRFERCAHTAEFNNEHGEELPKCSEASVPEKPNPVSAEVKPHGKIKRSPVSSQPISEFSPIVVKECDSFKELSSRKDVFDTNKFKGKNGHIKRPMNSFLAWAKKHRPIFAKANPNSTNKEISELLGLKWGKLTDEEKAPYYAESKQLHLIHSQAFPDWGYNPRKRQQSATDDVPVASPRKSTLQNSGVLKSATSPKSPVLQSNCHTVMAMPGGAPMQEPLLKSNVNLPGTSHSCSQEPLSHTDTHFAPPQLSFFSPSNMSEMPSNQNNPMLDPDCPMTQAQLMDLKDNLSQNCDICNIYECVFSRQESEEQTHSGITDLETVFHDPNEILNPTNTTISINGLDFDLSDLENVFNNLDEILNPTNTNVSINGPDFDISDLENAVRNLDESLNPKNTNVSTEGQVFDISDSENVVSNLDENLNPKNTNVSTEGQVFYISDSENVVSNLDESPNLSDESSEFLSA